ALLSVCQIDYELGGSLIETKVISPEHDRLPTGERMQPGLIEIPPVAVAINVNTGRAEWWGTEVKVYETEHGIGYNPDKFMAIWSELALPLLRLRGAGLSGKLR